MEKRPNIFRRIFNFFRNIFTPITYSNIGNAQTHEDILNNRQAAQDARQRPEEKQRMKENIQSIPFVALQKQNIDNELSTENPLITRYFRGKDGVTLEITGELKENSITYHYHTTDKNGVRDMLSVKEAFDEHGPFKLINKEKQDKILDKKGKSDRFLVNEFKKIESLTSKYAIIVADGFNITQDENGNLVYKQIQTQEIDGQDVVNKYDLSRESIINRFLSKYKYNNQELPTPQVFVNRALLKKDLEAAIQTNIGNKITREDGHLVNAEVFRINNKSYSRKQIEAALKDDVKFEKIAKEVEKQLRAKPLIPIKLFEKNKNIEIKPDISRKSKREAKANVKENEIKNAISNRELADDMTKGNYDAVYNKLHNYIPDIAMKEAVILAATENKNMKIFDKDGKEIKLFVDNDSRKSKIFVDVEYDGKKATYELTPKDASLSKFKVALTQGEDMEVDFPENERTAIAEAHKQEVLQNIEKAEQFFDELDDKVAKEGISKETIKEICDNLEAGQKMNCQIMMPDGSIINISESSVSNKTVIYDIDIDGQRKSFDINNEKDMEDLKEFMENSGNESLAAAMEKAEQAANLENAQTQTQTQTKEEVEHNR